MEENPDDENRPTEWEKPFDMDLFMQSIENEMEEEGIKCDTCDVSFFKKQDLKKHKESIHSTRSPRLQIPVKSKDHEKPPIIKQEDNGQEEESYSDLLIKSENGEQEEENPSQSMNVKNAEKFAQHLNLS